MKRKLIIASLLVISSLFIVGCGEDKKDNPPTDGNKNITQRFTTTNFSYEINDFTYEIIVDNITDNVYLHLNYGAGQSHVVDTLPLLDSDGKPVKFSSLQK